MDHCTDIPGARDWGSQKIGRKEVQGELRQLGLLLPSGSHLVVVFPIEGSPSGLLIKILMPRLHLKQSQLRISAGRAWESVLKVSR